MLFRLVAVRWVFFFPDPGQSFVCLSYENNYLLFFYDFKPLWFVFKARPICRLLTFFLNSTPLS